MRARLGAEVGRARRRFAARPAALRWSIGLAAVALLVALGYAVSIGTTTTDDYVLLRPGGRFSADDRLAIQNAFDIKHIRYQIDGKNRVEVAADQISEAHDALAKLAIGRKRLPDILKEELQDNLFDLPRTRERREAQARNEYLERLILPIDDRIVQVTVKLNRPDPRTAARRPGPVSAFVSIELDGERELSDTTIEKIRSLIAKAEPDVKHDAVSVFDQTGRGYLDAQDPVLHAQKRNRARQEDLRQEILERLDWLKGVQVWVQLVPVPAIASPAPVPPLASPARASAIEPAPAPAPALEDTARTPAPAIGVNQPLELAGEDSPELPLAAYPAPAPGPVSASPQPPVEIVPAPPPAAEAVAPKAKVLVQVPRSYYLNAGSDRKLSSEELQARVQHTQTEILKVVRHVVPAGQLDEPVDVSNVPDDDPVARSAEPPPELRKVAVWWIPAGVATGATTAILLLGFRVLSVRPPLRSSASGSGTRAGAGRARDDRARYKLDEASDPGPGPSERVRELIRLNPEAAASVLHRWTGQGGQPE